MTRLLELNLSQNKLVTLPKSIGRMTRLVRLNLASNQLADLPMSIGYCGGLGQLGAGINISQNPIDSAEMVKKFKVGTDHLLDFLEKRLSSIFSYF
jgi:Leucine-rich repeat (LRR) protein